jgi:hypothetical protein
MEVALDPTAVAGTTVEEAVLGLAAVAETTVTVEATAPGPTAMVGMAVEVEETNNTAGCRTNSHKKSPRNCGDFSALNYQKKKQGYLTTTLSVRKTFRQQARVLR